MEIIQSLADGVDPYSGERFASDSPYQQADTVRTLHLALEGLTKLRRSKARKTGPGRPWNEDEEQELLREFAAKFNVEEIEPKPIFYSLKIEVLIINDLQKLQIPVPTQSVSFTSHESCNMATPAVCRNRFDAATVRRYDYVQ
jgi:hypothetical protein